MKYLSQNCCSMWNWAMLPEQEKKEIQFSTSYRNLKAFHSPISTFSIIINFYAVRNVHLGNISTNPQSKFSFFSAYDLFARLELLDEVESTAQRNRTIGRRMRRGFYWKPPMCFVLISEGIWILNFARSPISRALSTRKIIYQSLIVLRVHRKWNKL